MSYKDRNGPPRSYGNAFPQSFGDHLPHSSQCEIIFPSSGNGGTVHRLSSTLPPPPSPVTLPRSRVERYEQLKPFCHVNMKMKIMCVRTF